MQMFSAHWTSFLNAGPLLRFWPSREAVTQEDFLFPGVTGLIAILACVALAWRQLQGLTRAFIFYVAAAAIMAWLAFGPSPAETPAAAFWHAYSWLAWLPGFSGLRVPARFFMLTTLCLAVAVGLAVAAIVRAFPRRAALVTGIVAAGLLADGWIVAMPLGAPPRPFGVPLERNARVLELPLADGNVNIGAIYRGMAHGLPVVNGYAGYVPPHADVIEWALRRHDPSVLTELRRGRPLYVAVANGPEAQAWTAFMDAQNDAQMLGVSGAGRLYLMPAAGYRPAITSGPPLAAVASRSDDIWVVVDLGRPSDRARGRDSHARSLHAAGGDRQRADLDRRRDVDDGGGRSARRLVAGRRARGTPRRAAQARHPRCHGTVRPDGGGSLRAAIGDRLRSLRSVGQTVD